MKRITMLIVATMLSFGAFAAWDGNTTSIWTNGDGSENNPYLIETEENLAYLAEQVNSGTSYSGEYFKQAADLDLGALFDEDGMIDYDYSPTWAPIGNKAKCFSGKYDGNGFVISNIYFSEGDIEYCGLFGGIKNAELKNITIASGHISGYQYVGGICGYATGSSQILCCANNASVYGTMERNGGIVGYIEGTTLVDNCINYGFVSAFNFSGGIVGFCNKTTTNVTNCINVGQVFSMRCTAGSLYGYNKDFGGQASNNYYDKQVNHSEGWTSVTNIIEQDVDVVGKVEGKSTVDMLGDGLKANLGDTYWEYTDGMYPRLKGSKDNDAIILAATPIVLASNEDVDDVKSNFTISTSNNVVWTNSTDDNIVAISGNNVTIKGNGPVQLLAKKGDYTKSFALRTNAENTYPTMTIDSVEDVIGLIVAMAYNIDYKGLANYNGFKGVNFVLNDDISLFGFYDEDNDSWIGIPVGYIGMHNSFKGNFDGQNHTIENVYAEVNDAIVGGLFGCVSYGTIKNVNISSGYVSTSTQHAGGLSGASFCENFINCNINCTVTAGNKNYAAGIVSYDKGWSTFTNCKNYGNVSSIQYVGGIIAKSDIGTVIENCENHGNITVGTNGKAGSMCGTANTGISVSNSRNYGSIYGTTLIGGIIGQSVGSVLTNCENNGEIIGTLTKVGGIIGESKTGHISNCINLSKVSGSSTHTAGIIGESNTDTIMYCINTDSIISSGSNTGGIVGGVTQANTLIDACLNSGYIKGASSTGGICGATGSTSKLAIKNCLNSGNIKSTTGAAGGIIGTIASLSSCESSINIGFVESPSSKGAIAGSNSGSIDNCYSDDQLCDIALKGSGSDATNSSATFTKNLVSDALKAQLGEDNWTYGIGLYPCPKGLENDAHAQVAISSLELYVSNDEMEYDDVDNVTKNFKIGYANGVKWSCSSDLVGFIGKDAFINPSKEKDSTIVVIAKKSGIEKSIAINIKKALNNATITPTIVWNGIENMTYGDLVTDDMLNATVEEDIEGTFFYSINAGQTIEAGTNVVTISYVPTTTGYNVAIEKYNVVVAKADPTITWETPASIVYGTAIDNTQLNAQANIEGSFNYTNEGAILGVGTHQLKVTFKPSNANYNDAEKTVDIIVTKATPVLVWATPSDITYGEAISSQLNAISTTEGTITYSVNVGDVLNAGNNTLTAKLTPTSGNYDTTSVSVVLNVRKAASEITWNPTQTSFSYGESIEAALNATSTIDGTIAYNVDKNAALNVGTHNITATLTPTSGNYESSTKTISVTISKASSEITWIPTNTSFAYGESIEAAFNATSTVDGTITYSIDNNATLNVGSHEIVATLTPTTGNYEASTKSVSVNITKATLNVSVADAKIKQGEALPTFTIEYNGFVNNESAVNLAKAPSASCSADGKTAGTFDIVVSGGESANYDFVYTNGKLTVEKTDAIADNKLKLVAYPNPTADLLTIESDAEEARIFDQNGKLVLVSPLVGTTQIDLSNLPAGTYIVTAGNQTSRIVKK